MDRPSKLTPERQAWERMEGESVKAFGAFTGYLHMPSAERSYANLVVSYDKPTSYIRQISVWASKWEWQARLAAWVEYQAKTIATKYTQTQDEIIDAEYEDYHMLREKWLEQAKYVHPVERTTQTDKHGQVVILKTDSYGFKAHIEARKKISEGLRLAAEMPSKIERSEATGKGGEPLLDFVALLEVLRSRDS